VTGRPLLEVADWGDPFTGLEELIRKAPEDAQLWVRFAEGVRGLLARREGYPSNLEIQAYCSDAAAADPDWWEFVDLYRTIADDPELRVNAVCAIDLWTVRMRLEWGLTC
jgi:hypothetical protein